MSLALLSIVVPMSLLATFRLTGILKGPIKISETTTLEALKWEFERSSQTVTIEDMLRSSYSSNELSAALHLEVVDYLQHTGAIDYDSVRIVVSINSTTKPKVSMESVHVIIGEDSRDSRVNWDSSDFYFKNLSLIERTDYAEAIVRLAGINHPSHIYFSATAFWKLPSLNIRTHQIEALYELTYYNGTAYKKIIQPFELRILER